MSNMFEEYLAVGNKRLLELMAAEGMDQEEKEAVTAAFTEVLMNAVGEPEKAKECDRIIYSASANYIDGKITALLSQQKPTYADLEKAVHLCERQMKNAAVFKSNGWKMPSLKNSKPEKTLEQIQKKLDTVSLYETVAANDKKISDLLETARKGLSTKVCDVTLAAVEEQERFLAVARKKKAALPELKNPDLKKTRQQIDDLRKTSELKEDLHRKIQVIDQRIDELTKLTNSTPAQWKNIVDLCTEQSSLYLKCRDKQWPLPHLTCNRLDLIAEKYKRYQELVRLDDAISTEWDTLPRRKKYKELIDHCNKQLKNIEVCKSNQWPLPSLKNTNLEQLVKTAKEEKQRNDKFRVVKKYAITAAAIIVGAIALYFGIIAMIRQGMLRMPFNSKDALWQDADVIYQELSDTGFTNIRKQMDLTGWYESDRVTSIAVGKKGQFKQGDYFKPDAEIVINVSTPDRVYATEYFKDWKVADYQEFIDNLEKAGFTNIVSEEQITDDKRKDRLIETLNVNGIDYLDEDCYITHNAPIKVTYNSLQISMGHDSTEFPGMDVTEVVSELKALGFTDIVTEPVSTGWAKGNTIISVTVSGRTTYKIVQTFKPNSKIVVRYSSDDRVDITEEVSNFNKTNYNDLKKALEGKKLTKVSFEEVVTYKPSENHCVSHINIHDELYTSGECYVQKNAPITVGYYELKAKIGMNSSESESVQYTDLVADLKNKGFTDIKLLRADDLISGWIKKEGTVQAISIGGISDFTADDTFYATDPVVIVVHTFKGRGCDDITEIRK